MKEKLIAAYELIVEANAKIERATVLLAELREGGLPVTPPKRGFIVNPEIEQIAIRKHRDRDKKKKKATGGTVALNNSQKV